MDVALVVLEVELVQAVVGGGAVTVVVGVAGGVEVRLLLDSLPVSGLRAVDVRFVLLEAGQLSVAPEADMRMVVGGGLVPQSGVRVRLWPVVCLVVMVTDTVVTTRLAQDGHLRGAVETVVGRVVDGRAGAVRPEAGRGLLGGIVLWYSARL